MEVSYSSFRVKTETDSLLLGRWEKWKSRGSCGISKRSGKVLPLDFSAERLFPPPFYPRIVLETQNFLHQPRRYLLVRTTETPYTSRRSRFPAPQTSRDWEFAVCCTVPR